MQTNIHPENTLLLFWGILFYRVLFFFDIISTRNDSTINQIFDVAACIAQDFFNDKLHSRIGLWLIWDIWRCQIF